VLLLTGIFLVVLGLDCDRSIATGIAEAIKSAPHYRAILLLMGGVAAGILGFIMVFSSPHPRRPD
jgi:hypothetical protein